MNNTNPVRLVAVVVTLERLSTAGRLDEVGTALLHDAKTSLARLSGRQVTEALLGWMEQGQMTIDPRPTRRTITLEMAPSRPRRFPRGL